MFNVELRSNEVTIERSYVELCGCHQDDIFLGGGRWGKTMFNVELR
jgi:hypothetical protein